MAVGQIRGTVRGCVWNPEGDPALPSALSHTQACMLTIYVRPWPVRWLWIHIASRWPVAGVDVGPLRPADLSAVEEALLLQQDRRLRYDPRLPKLTTNEMHCQLCHLLESPAPIVVAKSVDRVVGLAVPRLQVYGRSSDMLTYWPSRKGESAELVVGCRQDAANGVAKVLLSALEDYWAAWRTTGAGLVWPTRDIDLSQEFSRYGFRLDAQLAFRNARDRRGDGPQTHELLTRHAARSDTDAVVDIYLQVIEAHIPHSPFARHTEGAEPSFRARLEAILSTDGNDDDSFVLVGQLDGRVVAAADCQVSIVNPSLSPILPPGRYGYINSFGVSSKLRRGGIGSEFEAAVHQEFCRRNVLGTYLWFSEYNVSARQFWPRLGYQPIWTSYQQRVAENSSGTCPGQSSRSKA
jgi:GNAT superfamily N-acetyltransferase